MSINAPGRAARAYRRDLDPAFVPVVVVVVDFSPVPGGKGGGGNGRGAAASLGAPSGSSPCAEYVRGRIIRARSPACLSLRGVLTLARAPCATVKRAGILPPARVPEGLQT